MKQIYDLTLASLAIGGVDAAIRMLEQLPANPNPDPCPYCDDSGLYRTTDPKRPIVTPCDYCGKSAPREPLTVEEVTE